MPNFDDEIQNADVNGEGEEAAVIAKLKKPLELTAAQKKGLKSWEELAVDLHKTILCLDEAEACVTKCTSELDKSYNKWIIKNNADTESWSLDDLKNRARVYKSEEGDEVAPKATKKKKTSKKKAKKKAAPQSNLTAYDKAVAIKHILQKKAEILGKDLDKALASKLGIDVKKITQQFFTPTLEGETLNLRQTSDKREGTQKYIHKKNTLVDCNKIINANN